MERTIIDENRKTIRVIYTGSSQDGLKKLFSRREAALFQSSSQIELPMLGSGFVEHMRSCFREATGRELSYADGQEAFNLLSHMPRVFRSVIEGMALTGAEDIMTEARLAYDEQLQHGEHTQRIGTAKRESSGRC